MFLIALMTDMSVGILLLTWLVLLVCYGVFRLGYHSKRDTVSNNQEIDEKDSFFYKHPSILLIMSALVIVFAIINSIFYAGMTPARILLNLRNNVSVYYQYQNYSKDNAIASMSILRKAPYILTQYYNAMMLFCGIPFMVFGNFKKKVKIIGSILVTFGIAYFGIARGTSYEYFQLAVVWIYVAMRKMKPGRAVLSNLIKYILISVLLFLAINIFFSNVQSRGVDISYVSFPNIHFDDRDILPSISKTLCIPISWLYGYFGFGQYYNARFISDVWLKNEWTLIGGFFPNGLRMAGIQNIRTAMDNLIDVGVKWHPDFSLCFYEFGIIVLMIFIWWLGKITKKTASRDNVISSHFIQIMVLLQMMSFPIGNFIFVAGYMELTAITALMLYIKDNCNIKITFK